MVFNLPSLGILYALLILAPGYCTFRLAKYHGVVTDEYDNFDKGILTFLGSGWSLSVSVLLFMVGYYILNGIFLSPEDVVNFGPLSGAIIFLLTFSVAIVSGISFGKIIHRWLHDGANVKSNTTWQLISKHKQEPAEVRVFTKNGDEIWGQIRISDSEPHGQDLLLDWPQRIYRDEEGETKSKKSIGRHIFISESSISEIHYEDEIYFDGPKPQDQEAEDDGKTKGNKINPAENASEEVV